MVSINRGIRSCRHKGLCYHGPDLRILLDYRPALRQRTGVGEYVHEIAAALTRLLSPSDSVTLFSSSWKDRLPRNTEQITLLKTSWQVPDSLALGEHHLVPLRAGEKINWKLKD